MQTPLGILDFLSFTTSRSSIMKHVCLTVNRLRQRNPPTNEDESLFYHSLKCLELDGKGDWCKMKHQQYDKALDAYLAS